jgi:hypothetical protein
MRALTLPWSRAFSLVCEVALSEELLDAMNLFMEAADLYSTIDAGADINDPRLLINYSL